MRPVVVGQEHELALRTDHPHAVPDRQPPQQRREGPALDKPDVHLVAVGPGRRRRRRDRIRALDHTALDHHADRHVLAALERGRIAVEADPEVGERIVLVDPADEGRVVLLRRGFDDPRVVGQDRLGHGRGRRLRRVDRSMVPGRTTVDETRRGPERGAPRASWEGTDRSQVGAKAVLRPDGWWTCLRHDRSSTQRRSRRPGPRRRPSLPWRGRLRPSRRPHTTRSG